MIRNWFKKKEDRVEKIKIPRSLEECYEYLDVICEKEPDNLKIIRRNESEFVGKAHMGIGQWMRNNWGLWKKKGHLYDWFVSQGLGHADDMSGVILTSYHRRHHNKPILLEEQIKYYEEFWNQQNIDPLTLEKSDG